jgi:2-polyprenyl-3-methyl-5-hydroxy-6-metoxy-1,4-benzoquinol methylase
MPYIETKNKNNLVIIENIQDFFTAILEYYDELFPVDENILPLFLDLQQKQKVFSESQNSPMCRYLGIGCATGNLENRLAGQGFDITGIDRNPAMIETAKRRMKRGFSTIRFFEMSAIDIRRFLKKGSFHIIGCLGNVLPYICDETLLRKFFYDAKELLVPGGNLVIQTRNYDGMNAEKPVRLEDKKSVRVTLSRGYTPSEGGKVFLDATLEQGNGQKLILQKTTEIIPIKIDEIKAFAREAGFQSISVYGDFSCAPWTSSSPSSILVLS